jgi:hypothetical protein
MKKRLKDFEYASGNAICHRCGKTYSRHPDETEELNWRKQPYLKKLCDGRLVKL